MNYLWKGKLWEKQVYNLGFSQKPPTEFPVCFQLPVTENNCFNLCPSQLNHQAKI